MAPDQLRGRPSPRHANPRSGVGSHPPYDAVPVFESAKASPRSSARRQKPSPFDQTSPGLCAEKIERRNKNAKHSPKFQNSTRGDQVTHLDTHPTTEPFPAVVRPLSARVAGALFITAVRYPRESLSLRFDNGNRIRRCSKNLSTLKSYFEQHAPDPNARVSTTAEPSASQPRTSRQDPPRNLHALQPKKLRVAAITAYTDRDLDASPPASAANSRHRAPRPAH